jgi:geranylgeranyl diphosphate synthase type I
MAKTFDNSLQELKHQFQEEIDESCKMVHPRRFDCEYLKDLGADPKHSDISAYLTQALSTPNWDLLDRKRSRVRPLIFLLAVGGLGKKPERYVNYCAITELIHNGSLVHDDIEDNSEVRRNDKSLHKKYGLDIAVNSANLMYFSSFLAVKNDRLLTESKKIRLYESIIEHLNRLTWGQALDILWHKSDSEVCLEDYMQMCSYKTGAIDRMNLSIAGILCDCDKRAFGKVQAWGEKLGIGFQIHDDFLDICVTVREAFGGKPVGNDISEGKKSIVNILALRKLPTDKSKQLGKILHKDTKRRNDIQEALGLIEESGALEESSKIGQQCFKELEADCKDIFQEPFRTELSRFLKDMICDFEEKYGSGN